MFQSYLTVSTPVSQLVAFTCVYPSSHCYFVWTVFCAFFFFFSCFRNLSYNNLSGVIPSMKNFSRFSADRYCKQALWFYCFWSSMYHVTVGIYWHYCFAICLPSSSLSLQLISKLWRIMWSSYSIWWIFLGVSQLFHFGILYFKNFIIILYVIETYLFGPFFNFLLEMLVSASVLNFKIV